MDDLAFERLAYAVFKRAVRDYRVNPAKFVDAEEYIKNTLISCATTLTPMNLCEN